MLDFLRSLEFGLLARAGSFPKQRVVIEPIPSSVVSCRGPMQPRSQEKALGTRLGPMELEPRPDWSTVVFYSNFPTIIFDLFLWEFPQG